MSLTVVCSHCDAPLKLKDRSKLGKKIACPKCGEPFVLKASDEDEDWGETEEAAPVRSSPGAARRPGAKGTKSRGSSEGGSGKVLLLIGGSVIAIALIGVGLWAEGVLKRGEPAQVANQNAAGTTPPTAAVLPEAGKSPSAPVGGTPPAAAASPAALVEQRCRRLIAAITGDPEAGKKEIAEVWATEAQTKLAFGELGSDVFQSVEQIKREMEGNLPQTRDRMLRDKIDAAKIPLTVKDTRSEHLSIEQKTVVALVPAKLLLFLVWADVNGKREELFPVIVFEDNDVRALPPFSLLAVRLAGKIQIPQATAAPAAPLAGAGREFQGTKAGDKREDNGLKMKLSWCPAGKFRMGLPQDQRFLIDPMNEDAVDVELTSGFWIGQMEVTEREWKEIMGAPEPKKDDLPISNISWDQATEFCRKLTQQERAAGRLPDGWEYNLPTEAQWEYACRAGTTAPFFFGTDPKMLDDYGWSRSNASIDGTPQKHPVGEKKPNAWELYDTLGNTAEYVRDVYQIKVKGGTDPLGPDSDAGARVLKGGAWVMQPLDCRCAYRVAIPAADRFEMYGFRAAIVRSTGK